MFFPPPQPLLPPLSASQLLAVLSSLCHGISYASQRHHLPASLIRSWTERQERSLDGRTPCRGMEKVAEWVLRQREQQLTVNEDILLQSFGAAVGREASLLDRYGWAVDFMLSRGLSLQPRSSSLKKKVPRSFREECRIFIRSLCSQVSQRKVLFHLILSA